MLITAQLLDNEALLMKGAKQYSRCNGYGRSLVFGKAVDEPLNGVDEIVAIDALRYARGDLVEQYKMKNVLREVNKAYCGFRVIDDHKPIPIATGNWGCGAFGGDVQLKAVIQLIACAAAKRAMKYYSFKNQAVVEPLCKLHKFLVDKNLSVSDVWLSLKQFDVEGKEDLFRYIKKMYSSKPSYKQDVNAFTKLVKANNSEEEEKS
eukprot:TRINITY_DN9475_c0_g1_i2.p1 TRINITY_DN9475_c0_g1~~TRINITY_DN9475_c0_g1_i2.p1  ORF type:complete len:206 (-),score=43.94 TRINITY_DN9475_c0_g1_i2:130-747(-)